VLLSDKRNVTGPVEDANKGLRTVTVDGALEQHSTAETQLSAGNDMTVVSGTKVILGVGEGGPNITIDGSSITLTVGKSTVKIDPSGVTVNGAKISLN
jgi:type VI secretion system secreted protein VgrG